MSENLHRGVKITVKTHREEYFIIGLYSITSISFHSHLLNQDRTIKSGNISNIMLWLVLSHTQRAIKDMKYFSGVDKDFVAGIEK